MPTTVNSRTHHSKKKACTPSSSLSILPSPRKPPTFCLVFLDVPVWTFHISSIIWYAVFCGWLLSLQCFQGPPTWHVFLSSLWWVILHCVDIPRYSFFAGHLGYFYFLAVRNSGVGNLFYTGSCVAFFSVLLGICPGVELLGQVVTVFNHGRDWQAASQGAAPF